MFNVKIVPVESGQPSGKLADAELHFTEGILAGLKLIGFGIWQVRQDPNRLNITFPARQYSVNGERRSFAVLRPGVGFEGDAQEALKQAIIQAYRDFQAAEVSHQDGL